jgi:hypothetical protein
MGQSRACQERSLLLNRPHARTAMPVGLRKILTPLRVPNAPVEPVRIQRRTCASNAVLGTTKLTTRARVARKVTTSRNQMQRSVLRVRVGFSKVHLAKAGATLAQPDLSAAQPGRHCARPENIPKLLRPNAQIARRVFMHCPREVPSAHRAAEGTHAPARRLRRAQLAPSNQTNSSGSPNAHLAHSDSTARQLQQHRVLPVRTRTTKIPGMSAKIVPLAMPVLASANHSAPQDSTRTYHKRGTRAKNASRATRATQRAPRRVPRASISRIPAFGSMNVGRALPDFTTTRLHRVPRVWLGIRATQPRWWRVNLALTRLWPICGLTHARHAKPDTNALRPPCPRVRLGFTNPLRMRGSTIARLVLRVRTRTILRKFRVLNAQPGTRAARRPSRRVPRDATSLSATRGRRRAMRARVAKRATRMVLRHVASGRTNC